MEEIEEGVKEKAIFRPSSHRWVGVDKHNWREENSRRAQHEPKPGDVEHSGNSGKSSDVRRRLMGRVGGETGKPGCLSLGPWKFS